MRIERQFNIKCAKAVEVDAPVITTGPGASALGIKARFNATGAIGGMSFHMAPDEARQLGARLIEAAAPQADDAAPVSKMNAREKAVAIADWLGWQDEDLAFGLRSVADAEKLYDYWQARNDTLPEMADEEWYSESGKESDRIYLNQHRIAALGYDPMVAS